MEQHISTKQVCLLLGISLYTFYRYCKACILKPAFFTFGNHRRFSLSLLRQSFNIENNAVNKVILIIIYVILEFLLMTKRKTLFLKKINY